MGLNQLKYKEAGYVDGFTEEFHSPVCDANIALDRRNIGVEKTTVRNREPVFDSSKKEVLKLDFFMMRN